MIYFRNVLRSDMELCEHVKMLDVEPRPDEEDMATHTIPVRVRCEVCQETFELTILVD